MLILRYKQSKITFNLDTVNKFSIDMIAMSLLVLVLSVYSVKSMTVIEVEPPNRKSLAEASQRFPHPISKLHTCICIYNNFYFIPNHKDNGKVCRIHKNYKN